MIRINGSRYPAKPVVFVDVDGTLIDREGEPLVASLEWCRRQHAAGYQLFLWSMQGAEHATAVAERLGITELFAFILSKPSYVLDDDGWAWVRYTRTCTPRDELPPARAFRRSQLHP